MSDREKVVQFLREKAAQFRHLGNAHKTPLSARMLEVARDIEAQADKIERRASRDCDAQPEH
jgi:tRNA(Ser,Leu) C12 N-acetylase TAN1